MDYQVLLYYHFHPIANVEALIAEHKEFAKKHQLLGRIYVSKTEGINGTVGGKKADTEAYMEWVRTWPGFEATEFKIDETDSNPFARFIVKHRPEIVALKSPIPLDVASEGTNHLPPSEWRQVLESGEDIHLIDVRNNYESKVGHFEGAILPDVENFYDFPQWLDDHENELDKNKKVLMYCTGGIRCEKFSILMQKKGYKNVFQLQGGILNYAKKEGGVHYKGKCFVFDDRLIVPVNPLDDEPISHCEITGEPCDMYINCANMECNRLFVCTPEGAEKMKGCCSEACTQSAYLRPFNADNAYAPFRRWYHYFGDEFKQREHPSS